MTSPPGPDNPPPYPGPPRTSAPLKDKYQLAAYLGVKVGWVTRRITARTIPITWIGRHARFSAEDVAEIEAQGKEPAVPATRLAVVRNRGAA
jgi:excisionase family DNA binding protein